MISGRDNEFFSSIGAGGFWSVEEKTDRPGSEAKILRLQKHVVFVVYLWRFIILIH